MHTRTPPQEYGDQFQFKNRFKTLKRMVEKGTAKQVSPAASERETMRKQDK